MHILIIEDDEVLGDGIQAVLNQREFTAQWARDGLAGYEMLENNFYDLLVLDLNLPRMSGMDILRNLRSRNNRLPVLALTARSAIDDRVQALDLGADDYVVKPFEIDELCARIRALYRRSLGQTATHLQLGDIVLDPAAHVVTVKGERVTLSKKEFAILRLLMEKSGRVLSRRHLEESMYGVDGEVGSNAVEVHIHNIRHKLGINPIRTVRGVGYVIEKPD